MMQITKWARTHPEGSGQMVRVTKREALKIIMSLTVQLYENNANTERAEFFDQYGDYFSIAVCDPDPAPPDVLTTR